MRLVSSPCTKVCIMDAAAGLCRGCGRTLQEIGAWALMSEAERIEVMAILPARMAAVRAAPVGQAKAAG
jgi:predicted Fe-S protein YdhL (DUF1289 family)